MLLSLADVKVRSFEHQLRIDAANRFDWLVDSARHADRTKRQPSILRSIVRRLSNPLSLGTRTRRDAARGIA